MESRIFTGLFLRKLTPSVRENSTPATLGKSADWLSGYYLVLSSHRYNSVITQAITRYPLSWHCKQKEIKNQLDVTSPDVTSSHGIWNLVTHEDTVSDTRLWWFLLSAVCNLRALQLSGYFGKTKVRLGKVLEEKEKMVGGMLVDLLLSMQFNTHSVTESKDGSQQPQSPRKLFENPTRYKLGSRPPRKINSFLQSDWQRYLSNLRSS